jgi:hypothetical protein
MAVPPSAKSAMASPLVLLVVVAGVVTLLALVGSGLGLWSSTRRLAGKVREVREELEPQIALVNDDVAVAQQELERVREAIDELKAGRDR